MRKYARDTLQWLCLRQARQKAQQLRAAGVQRHRKRGRLANRGPEFFTAPDSFCLFDDKPREELLQFLKDVEGALRKGLRVKIGFGHTTKLFPCGTLYFLAHIDRWRADFPAKIGSNYPKDEVVEELFEHVGFLESMGLPSRRVVSHERVKYWHYLKGVQVTPADWALLLENIVPQVDHPSKALFGDCLNEAVTNVVHHGYKFPSGRRHGSGRESWWMFSQPKDERLFVVVCDLGIGIPKHLRERFRMSDLLYARTWNDAKMIGHAVGSSRSGTELAHRGKGLPEMLEFCKELSAGGLDIYSSGGRYRYVSKEGADEKRTYRTSIRGTVVIWDLPLESQVV